MKNKRLVIGICILAVIIVVLGALLLFIQIKKSGNKELIAEDSYINNAWAFTYKGKALFSDGTIYVWKSSDKNYYNSAKSGVVITSDGITTVNNSDFELIYEETTGSREDDGTYIIKGKIKQNTTGSYTGLMLTLDLLDENNNKIREHINS